MLFASQIFSGSDCRDSVVLVSVLLQDRLFCSGFGKTLRVCSSGRASQIQSCACISRRHQQRSRFCSWRHLWNFLGCVNSVERKHATTRTCQTRFTPQLSCTSCFCFLPARQILDERPKSLTAYADYVKAPLKPWREHTAKREQREAARVSLLLRAMKTNPAF